MNHFQASGRIVGIDYGARPVQRGPQLLRLTIETPDGEAIRFGFFGDQKPQLFQQVTIQGKIRGEFDGAMSLVLESIEIEPVPALQVVPLPQKAGAVG